MSSIKMTARMTGFLYLLIAVIAPFSMLYIPSTLVVPEDAAATASNIVASESLFRLGIVSDSIVFLIEIALVVLLYVLFRPVNKSLALIAMVSRLAMTVVQGLNLLNNIYVLLLISGANYLAAFNAEQIQALVMMFLKAHDYGAYIWGAFFGFHCLFLGNLLYKSGFFPKIVCSLLGILLLCAGLGYLIDSFGNFLNPNFNPIISGIFLIPGTLGELILALWLLIKGVKL
jgi:hypothetical protein